MLRRAGVGQEHVRVAKTGNATHGRG
jgi:hypothetical protein